MVRKCAVRKCSNGLRQLEKWRQQDCLLHGSKYGIGRCICFQPFYLFGFPSEARDPDARKEWIKLVNRQDKNGGIWQPKPQDRVCSEHFIDKKPTTENPYPTLKLGYSPPLTPKGRMLEHRGGPNVEQSKTVHAEHLVDREPARKNPHPTLKIVYGQRLALMGKKLPYREGDPSVKQNKNLYTLHLVDRGPVPKNLHPTLKLGSNPHSTSKRKEIVDEDNDPNAKRSKLSNTFSTYVPANLCLLIKDDHNYDFSSYACTCKPSCSCTGCQQKQAEIQKLRHENELLKAENALQEEQLKVNSLKGKKLPFPQSILTTDAQVKENTGLPSKATLLKLCDGLKSKVTKMEYWSGKQKTISTKAKKKSMLVRKVNKKLGRKRKLSKFEELVLVLMKLRLALPMSFLGSLFGVSKSTCSSILHTWIKFLAAELKSLIIWPGRESVENKMPDTVKKLCPTLRCILDCAEFYIEGPGPCQLQAPTKSDCNNNSTAKVLVGIAPDGMITFLSKTFGGNTPVNNMTLESGFYNLLEPGDTVMSTKQFPIHNDLMIHGCTFQTTLAAKDSSQCSKEVVKQNVPNLKLHVKTAIGRLKQFQILKKMLPIALFPLLDDIVLVCAALTNLLPPLKEDEL